MTNTFLPRFRLSQPCLRLSGKRPPTSPRSPIPTSPLFPHVTGRWAKKIREKLHCLGPWDQPGGALQLYLDQRDDLYAGRTPRVNRARVNRDGLSLRDLVNRLLTFKQQQRDHGEITNRSFLDYHRVCQRIVSVFGLSRLVDDLATDDFESLRAQTSKTWGPVSLGNKVQRVRVVFKYAYDAGLVDKPLRYGPGFKRPSKKVLREARNRTGPRMFEREELRAVLDAAGIQTRAMLKSRLGSAGAVRPSNPGGDRRFPSGGRRRRLREDRTGCPRRPPEPDHNGGLSSS